MGVMRTNDPASDARWSCFRKKAYPTEAMARSAARSASDRTGIALTPYGCTRCGRWHIGRTPGP